MTMRAIYKKEAWGFSMWRGGVQYGASVGPIEHYLGRKLAPNEWRLWRRGLFLVRE